MKGLMNALHCFKLWNYIAGNKTKTALSQSSQIPGGESNKKEAEKSY